MMDKEQRIQQRAFEIWVAEGRPAGQHDRHWQMAREAIAQEETLKSTVLPAEANKDAAEDAAVENAVAALDNAGKAVPAKRKAGRAGRK